MLSQAAQGLRQLPHGLEGLVDLALDMRWSWSHATDRLWAAIDPQLWQSTRNAWLTLYYTPISRLQSLSQDAQFLARLHEYQHLHQAYQERTTWFEQTYPHTQLGKIAYFCMEFGLAEALPIYSGGLGMLAGDMLKVASDLGLPMLGVGLLYQQGYFRQGLRADTDDQLAFYPYNEPSQLPVMPVCDQRGEWLHVEIELPGRSLYLRCWQVQVGRVRLYLLDSNHPLNAPPDRGITSQLYPADLELRLQQELVLGVGGWRLLQALGEDVQICHLNEGHAAFAILERARQFAYAQDLTFEQAWQALRAGNVFTTHTPVPAGHDRFSMDQAIRILGAPRAQALERLGCCHDNLLNLTYIALCFSRFVNGVSMQHGKVSREMFPDHQIEAITNGVHVPTWTAAPFAALFDRHLSCWRQDNLKLRYAIDIPEFEIEQAHAECKRTLLRKVEQKTGVRLNPDRLTLGFARRAATYKRADLLFTDPARLLAIARKAGGLQILYGGKAHPQDEPGKALIERVVEDAARSSSDVLQVLYLENYNWPMGALLTAGVDVWLNTPRRPYEASGTSGMKAALNGVPSLSILDGWWIEGCIEGYTGWAIEDGESDEAEAESLYRKLESAVVPAYQSPNGGWERLMRNTIASNGAFFNTNRMLEQYLRDAYYPAPLVAAAPAAVPENAVDV
jgi:starch phosphorylase